MTDKQYFTFDRYFEEFLLKWEGAKYENVANDSGGATKFGIDQASHPLVNIRALTKEKAKDIYFNEYWVPVAADKLKPRTAWVLMDCGVNCGRITAIQWLQKIVGVKVDGRIGPITIKAANGYGDDVAIALINRRQKLYNALAEKKSQRKFLKGWTNRNRALESIISQVF